MGASSGVSVRLTSAIGETLATVALGEEDLVIKYTPTATTTRASAPSNAISPLTPKAIMPWPVPLGGGAGGGRL